MFEDPNRSVSSTAFIRELLEETPLCDKYSDLSDVRIAYITKLMESQDLDNHETIVKRIKDLAPLNSDEKVAIEVVNHFNGWTQDRLLSCFNYRNWLGYQIAHTMEKTMARIGRFTLGEERDKEPWRGAKKLTENSIKSMKSKSS